MIDGMKVLAILFGGVLTDNFVFSRFFAERSALGADKFKASLRIGAWVALMIALVSIVTSALYFFVLMPLKLGFLTTAMFALVILAVFSLFNRILKAKNPFGLGEPTALHALIALVGAVLGAALFSAQAESFLYGALTGVFGGAGFLLAVVLLAGVRERLALSDVPEGLKGLPIALVSAGLIALALLGFSGFGS